MNYKLHHFDSISQWKSTQVELQFHVAINYTTQIDWLLNEIGLWQIILNRQGTRFVSSW